MTESAKHRTQAGLRKDPRYIMYVSAGLFDPARTCYFRTFREASEAFRKEYSKSIDTRLYRISDNADIGRAAWRRKPLKSLRESARVYGQ